MRPFDQYFSEIYGDRWPRLKEALLADPQQGLFLNPFIQDTPPRLASFKKLKDGLWLKDPRETFSPERHPSGWLDTYILDPASVFVAESVEVKASDKVLDMCAAPGGKSLVLFSKLSDGQLISNDISQDRRFRMKKIFEQYIPAEARQRIHIKGWDGLQYGLRTPEEFDRILLDAPCSGERHLLENEKETGEWKPKRAESLAKRQYGLLCSALLALKSGGTIVYSTCSINPAENDGVIERLVDRKGSGFDILPLETMLGAEKTRFGLQFLPDVSGYGPMFCCKIRKHEGLSSD